MCWRDDHAFAAISRAPLLDPTQDRLKGLRGAAGARRGHPLIDDLTVNKRGPIP